MRYSQVHPESGTASRWFDLLMQTPFSIIFNLYTSLVFPINSDLWCAGPFTFLWILRASMVVKSAQHGPADAGISLARLQGHCHADSGERCGLHGGVCSRIPGSLDPGHLQAHLGTTITRQIPCRLNCENLPTTRHDEADWVIYVW